MAYADSISGTNLKTWENAEQYFDDFLKRAFTHWKCSAFEDIKVLDASNDQVHLNAEIRRFDDDNNLITQFRSLFE